MKKLLLVLLALALAGCGNETREPDAVVSTDDEVPMEETFVPAGEIVALTSTGDATGYLSLPIEPHPSKPALILIHEWWGLDDWIRENADRYAAKGYVVLAPDLYRGAIANDADEAHQLMRGLPEDRAMDDMKAAYKWLAGRDDVHPANIGVTGWCMGGGYALAFATTESRLGAVSINYGRLVTDPKKIARIRAPILGIFGGQDKGIPVEDVEAFRTMLDEKGVENTIRIFEGSGHAFMNPNNDKGYDAEAAKEAWGMMDAFFEAELQPR
jgi:carboxymethylenebutenolidase